MTKKKPRKPKFKRNHKKPKGATMSEEKNLKEATVLEKIDLVTVQRDLYKLDSSKLSMQILDLNMKVAQLEVQVKKKELQINLDTSQSQHESNIKSLCDRYGVDLSNGDNINAQEGVITRTTPPIPEAADEEEEDEE